MNGQVRSALTEIDRSTHRRWILLEQALIVVECAAIGAMLASVFGSGTLCQIAVGGLVGLLIAALVPLLAAIKDLPDSLSLAAAFLIRWVVLVLPLLVVPSAVCSWLGSVHGWR